MVHRAARDNRDAGYGLAARAGHAKLAGCAAGLVVVWTGLALAAMLAPRLMIDARACAVLASACLNLLLAVIGTRLAMQRMHASTPLWKTLLQLARLAFRHDRSKAAAAQHEASSADDERAQWQALLRALPWRPAVVPFGALVSIALAVFAWTMPAPGAATVSISADLSNMADASVAASAGSHAPLLVAGVAALLLAFAALYAERVQTHRASQAMQTSQDAQASCEPAALAGLLRVILVVSLSAAAAAAWFAQTGEALTWLVRLVAVLSGLVAVELAARSVWAAFVAGPSASSSSSTSLSDSGLLHSALANALRVQARPFAALSAQLRMRYGIDLRQNWALQSFVRLLPAAIATVVVLGWLLGGVAVLGPDQRAVYERFGAPVAVWQPGLHVGLPWPFGRTRVIDNGAVHQLIVSGSANDASQAAPGVAADAAPPDQLNRLWDVAHPWETTQVIAGTSGDQQAFQVVSADVRLDYRIALSDAAARAALYRAVDMDETVRAIANRAVVRYLASRTLQSLIDTPQTAMANTLRASVQGELDRLASGIEVMAVVIESVHPPAGAAAAYHGVQAAQIRAQASVVQARGFAAATLGGAQQQAIEAVAQGSADAADTLATARVQQIDFDADVIAQGLGGPAFAFEYYLHRLQKGLQNASVTIIDDRLASGNRATIDLRTFTPATAAAGVRPAW
ncbi:SPFH domain-containing protein [Paraburkholderia tropica]|uniref:SPFH domain-containing protein n=1 Tax=Paraburkholderia tropica TaxID=92647 RepID=UPI002AB6D822|nr:SPFH domain-containing protein [Paraburkholderia tropica]